MAQSNGHSNGKAALTLDELRKRLREAQGNRTILENKRTSAIAERDRMEANYVKLLREGGDLERAYTRKKVANDLVEDLAMQITEAEARVTSIQFQISDIEAADQRQRDFIRLQEIAERRDAIRGEITQIWQSAATKENELGREADALAAELQSIQARAPRAGFQDSLRNPEPLLRVNGRLVHA